MDKQLSLVLPCYKPEAGWAEGVVHYYNELQRKRPGTSFQLILVNDGDTSPALQPGIDKLRSVIPDFSYYSYERNRGKGYALRYGISRANTASVIYTDLDFPYSTDSICRVADLLDNYSAVIGIKDSDYYKSVPFWRKKISRWLQQLIAFCFPAIITADTQCGLKGLKDEAKAIFLTTRVNNYLFDLEFILLISKEKAIRATTQEVQLRQNVQFSGVSVPVLFRELFNFIRIILSRRFPGPKKTAKNQSSQQHHEV